MSATLAPAVQRRRDVPPGCPLTRREFELVAALAAGLTYKEIARDWGVTLPTVRHTASTTYARLGVTSGAQAVGHCFRDGWLGKTSPELSTLALAVDRLSRAVASEEKSSLTSAQRGYLQAFEDYLYARTDHDLHAARQRMDLTARSARIVPHPERPARELMDTLVLLVSGGWVR